MSYALGDGSIESCKGSLEHHHKFTILGEHEGDDGLYILRWTDPDGKDDEAIMNISEPFDQEDGTQSLIVTDGIMG
ncbi:hypothetical protein, partial [Propionibacterium freudenreichii]|uniref:hypothetical protein n=1 Tax=Propionibacterium freudenreichii TaxID=1744 RepID=UPI003854C6AE